MAVAKEPSQVHPPSELRETLVGRGVPGAGAVDFVANRSVEVDQGVMAQATACWASVSSIPLSSASSTQEAALHRWVMIAVARFAVSGSRSSVSGFKAAAMASTRWLRTPERAVWPATERTARPMPLARLRTDVAHQTNRLRPLLYDRRSRREQGATMFVGEPVEDEAVAELYRADLDGDGYVMNLTRLWAWRPEVTNSFLAARAALRTATGLSSAEQAVLVCAMARALGDSYCSLAWGANLTRLRSEGIAAELVATGSASGLSAREAALAEWAAKVVEDPNATTAADVDRLRAAGLSDQDIFDATLLVAFRQAFSTVNDALGAAPDRQLWDSAPEAVRDHVTFGRSPA